MRYNYQANILVVVWIKNAPRKEGGMRGAKSLADLVNKGMHTYHFVYVSARKN
jgi:hypothetical protein